MSNWSTSNCPPVRALESGIVMCLSDRVRGSGSGRKTREFEAKRAQSFAGGLVIGLWIGLRWLYAVEEWPALGRNIVASRKIQDSVAALLHRADRCNAAFAHHRGIHIGRRMQR